MLNLFYYKAIPLDGSQYSQVNTVCFQDIRDSTLYTVCKQDAMLKNYSGYETKVALFFLN